MSNFLKKLAQSVQGISSEEKKERKIYIQEEEEERYDEYDDDEEIGELSIDMFRLENAIIIRAMIAGVKKDDIEITLSRDSITIEGVRKADDLGEIYDNYFDELYWGPFERSIDLPEEVDIEMAEAHENHGLLTIILPLVDKNKRTKLKIK